MIYLHYHTPYRRREREGRGGGEGREGEGEWRERGGREGERELFPHSPSLPLPHYFKTNFCYYKRFHDNHTSSVPQYIISMSPNMQDAMF